MNSIFKLSFVSVATMGLMVLSAPATAGSSGYSSTISSTLSTPVKLDIRLSESLAYRAENLPKKLSDRGSGSRLNNGFGNNGYYGEKDLNQLKDKLADRLADRFDKSGIVINEDAALTLVVTIEDARPNRPTFRQLSKDPSLSYESFGLGGAELKSELIDTNGNSLGTAEYRWYETNIRDAKYGGTWSDANRAFRSFSKKMAKNLVSTPNS